MEYNEVWNLVREIIKDVSQYAMPIAAFFVSVVALFQANKCAQVQIKLSEIERKIQEYDLELKKYELEKITREINDKKGAYIEARVINISKDKYILKVWNSGDETAYDIDVEIPSEYQIILMKEKLPFEYLEKGNGFEERVVVHHQSSSKFRIICRWKDEDGTERSNEQLRDF